MLVPLAAADKKSVHKNSAAWYDAGQNIHETLAGCICRINDGSEMLGCVMNSTNRDARYRYLASPVSWYACVEAP